jgi:hypothetical protein
MPVKRPEGFELVEAMRGLGVSVNGAVTEALGSTLREFTAKHHLPYSSTVEALHGRREATDRLIIALSEELGGTPRQWREVLPRRIAVPA